jgi:hypothetical protein
MTRKILMVAIAALAYFGQDDRALDGRNAHAIIGRPLTPMSYAGVARRTARRTAYAGAAYAGAAYAGAAAVATLPAGCVVAGGVYTCGTVRYQAYYDGPTVVYQPM